MTSQRAAARAAFLLSRGGRGVRGRGESSYFTSAAVRIRDVEPEDACLLIWRRRRQARCSEKQKF